MTPNDQLLASDPTIRDSFNSGCQGRFPRRDGGVWENFCTSYWKQVRFVEEGVVIGMRCLPSIFLLMLPLCRKTKHNPMQILTWALQGESICSSSSRETSETTIEPGA